MKNIEQFPGDEALENSEKELSPEAERFIDSVNDEQADADKILVEAVNFDEKEKPAIIEKLKEKMNKLGRKIVLITSIFSVFGGASSALASNSDDAFAELRARKAHEKVETPEQYLQLLNKATKTVDIITGTTSEQRSAHEREYDANGNKIEVGKGKKVEKEKSVDVKKELEGYFKGKKVEVLSESEGFQSFVVKIDGVFYCGGYSERGDEEGAEMLAKAEYVKLISGGGQDTKIKHGDENFASATISGLHVNDVFTSGGTTFVLVGGK